MGVTWVDPVEITPGSTGSYIDVDLSSYIDTGTTGVILEVVNNYSSNKYYFGCRKNGSTDELHSYIGESSHLSAFCGVDTSRILEIYVSSTSRIDVYLIGYFDDCAVFPTNSTNISLSTTGTWTDININVNDGAIAAMVEVKINSSSSYVFGFRVNGSTDSIYFDGYYKNWGIVGLDENEIFEGVIESTTVDFYLKGYIKSGAIFNTNTPTIASGSMSSYTDLSPLPEGATGAFLHACPVMYYTGAYAARKNGSSRDIYYDACYHCWYAVECDEDGIIEAKLERNSFPPADTNFLYLVGYTYSEEEESAAANALFFGMNF